MPDVGDQNSCKHCMMAMCRAPEVQVLLTTIWKDHESPSGECALAVSWACAEAL